MSSSEENNLFDIEDVNANVVNNDSSDSFDSLYSSEDSIGITRGTSQHGFCIPVITITSDDEDEQVSELEKDWAALPSLAIENIYSFLSRIDQSRMSQVCSRWANDFNSPCLWKTMKFYLPEQDYSSEIYPEVRFARKYASMFRHVEITCKRVRTHLIRVIWKQLKLFLQALESSSQLASIKFFKMKNYFRHLDDILYEDLFKTIINLFNSQKNLKTVVLEESRFSKTEGLDVLKAIFHSESNTIRNLTLRGFVNEAAYTELNSQYWANLSEVCSRIANVQSLEVDYTQIFEEIINCLYEKLSSGEYQIDKKKPSTSILNIYCEDKGQSGFKGILPETWRYLKNVFPNMKVKMDVTVNHNLNTEMEKFLVKGIPLQALDFRFGKISTSSRIDISDLFVHLKSCKYQYHLETLNILWMPSIADFIGSVIPFVQSCKKLETFHLHAEYTPIGIENVLKAFLENLPASLKSITLWFNNLQEDEDDDNLRKLSEEYYVLFNSQSIEFFLVVDPCRRLRGRTPNITVP
ncbi:hypothetical protein HNY73_008527 [Argiope bruennichi]|uniref:F-box domain-containing protein n=1 Tax=Argiope bruennichi TaxID=94029 RepID=A0A8T0F9A4_ARGBR|nr:hypothetical protein HNY73_008527 [Argiope bruennichi]